MPSETDRILCCAAMWVLAGMIWVLPQEAQSIDFKNAPVGKTEQAFQVGKSARTFEIANATVDQSPNTAEDYFALGKQYEAQGDGENARQDYSVYVQNMGRQLPIDPSVLIRLRRFNLY
jgi:hypothetical protein